MKPDLSILIPTIRTYNLVNLYNSIFVACKNYSWELILVGPFDLPQELKSIENVRFIKSYANVSRSTQIGVLHCSADRFFLTVDDCFFKPESIDKAMDLFYGKCSYRDIVNCRWTENNLVRSESFWNVNGDPEFQYNWVKKEWKWSLQFIIHTNYFRELGGIICNFEYTNHSLHHFIMRSQYNGSKIYNSPDEICLATFFPGNSVDHGPVDSAQTTHDRFLFQKIMSKGPEPIKIDYNNWQNVPEIWERRFPKKIPNSYEEMMKRKEWFL